MDEPRLSFSLNEANQLSHALLARVGQDASIRILSIKGLVADRYGLRAPRVAADADVMVDPARFDDFCELMGEHGWRRRVEREVPSLLGMHSVTLIREGWPNDIDVHIRFPGFFAGDSVVFDRLWRTRSAMTVAHTEITVPSRAGSAVIAALHAVRYSRSARHNHEWERLSEVLWEEFTEAERGEFIDISRVGKAQWVLRELFERHAVPYEIDVDAHQQRLWAMNRATIEDGAAVSWLAALRVASWTRKPAVLFRALWISKADIPRNDPDRVPSAREAWAHRMLRWRRGAAALANYLGGKRGGSPRPSNDAAAQPRAARTTRST